MSKVPHLTFFQQPTGIDEYKVAADASPLKDTSLLPDGMQQYCADKPVYWTEKILKDKEEKRQLGNISQPSDIEYNMS